MSRGRRRGAPTHGAAIPVVPVAETLKRIATATVVETVDRERPRRRPDAAGRPARPPARGLRALPARRDPRPGPTRPPCWRPVASPSMRSRRPEQPQGDPARRSRLASTAAARRPRRRRRVAGVGIGHDSHPFGPGAPLALGGIDDRRRAAAPRPLGRRRRCSTPSPTRCSARPGSAISAGSSRPARRRRAGIASAELLAEVVGGSRPPAGRRRDRRPHDRRRPAAARRRASTPMRDAIAELLGARPVGASTSRPRPATSTAMEGAGRGDLGAAPSRPSSRRPMTIRLHDTLTGETRPLDPLEPGRVGIYSLRPDGLRAGPHRQLPLVPVRRPARPPPALARAAR